MLTDKASEINNYIGVFDSGVGGISVLGRARNLLPGENFIYYGDTAHFPYGDCSPEDVLKNVTYAVEEMLPYGLKMLVLACNTATAVAIQDLREKYSIPVLGIEPALKPAVEKNDAGTIGIIATSLTLREKKFRDLFQQYRDRNKKIINLPAVGLADLVEHGHYKDASTKEYLEHLFAGIYPDTIVLGCTHYLFTLPHLRDMFPDADIIDGGEGLARNIRSTLILNNSLRTEEDGKIKILSSDNSFITRFPDFYNDIQMILKNNPNI